MMRLGQSGYCCSGGNIKQDLRRAQSSGAENKQTSVFGLECCEACARIRCFKCIFRRNRSTNIRLYSVVRTSLHNFLQNSWTFSCGLYLVQNEQNSE